MTGLRWLLDSLVKSMQDISLRVLPVLLRYYAFRTMGELPINLLLRDRQRLFIRCTGTFAFTCAQYLSSQTNLNLGADISSGPNSGTLYAVWNDARAGYTDVLLCESQDGLLWSDPISITAPPRVRRIFFRR